MIPARRIRFTGEVESRSDAEDRLSAPGDLVLVNRGRLRSAVIACPDGCGSILTINLDPRAGKAWRAYRERRGLSLYPSVWREGGCESHFIVWRDRIVWCNRYLQGNEEPDYGRPLEDRIGPLLTDAWITAETLAERLDEIPWEVSRAARELVRRGLAESGHGAFADAYRRAATLAQPARTPVSGPTEPSAWTRFWRWLTGR